MNHLKICSRLLKALPGLPVLFLALATLADAGDIKLAWDANTESDLAGYKLYYGQNSTRYTTYVDVGNRTSYTLSGLEDAKTYYLALTAYNTDRAESGYSNEIVAAGIQTPPPTAPDPADPGTPPVTPTPDPPPATAPTNPDAAPIPSDPAVSDSPGDGGGCFIATAAYGSYMAPEVMRLRNFRDTQLLTNKPGRLFVKLYYRYSPPAADVISRHEWMRTLTRWALTPIVYGVKYSPSVLLVMAIGPAVFSLTRIRRKRALQEQRGLAGRICDFQKAWHKVHIPKTYK